MQLAFKSSEMKRSVRQQKPTETERVTQRVSTGAVGSKSKHQMGTAIPVQSARKSEGGVSYTAISKVMALHII